MSILIACLNNLPWVSPEVDTKEVQQAEANSHAKIHIRPLQFIYLSYELRR